MKKFQTNIGRCLLPALLLLLITPGMAQTKDGQKIIDRVKEKFTAVKDYQVDVNIVVDVDFLKVPNSTAKIFFKQPDKVKIESEGFALVPKEGLNFTPQSLFKKAFTSFYETDEMLDGINCAKIKVIPLGNENEVILSTVWIDKKSDVIRKVESTTKMNGTFEINFAYDVNNTYPLPSQMVFSFDAGKMKSSIPHLDNDPDAPPKKPKRKQLTNGTVTVSYTNYKVNIGLSDLFFEKKGKK